VTAWYNPGQGFRHDFSEGFAMPIHHVHIAFWLHPAVSPARLVVTLMNEGQRVLAERFPEELIRARVPRFWQPSAYVGSYGELATP
jgi:hypothetical protein